VTNESFGERIKWMGGFYHNPKNLDRCVGNLLRSAVAVRRIMDEFRLRGVDMNRADEEVAVDHLLQAFDEHLDPLARRALQERGSENWASAG
jgi:hypothetical protein